ncbi:phage tail termination protein [Nocardia tengchongensis]
MTLHFPAWYQGGFPDRELVVIDALKPILDTVDVLDKDGNPILDAGQPRRPLPCGWLPEGYGSRLPIVRVFRGGGAANDGVMVDPASVQVATIAETRAESWELAEYCRQWLLSFSRGGTVHRADGSKTLVDCIEELVGPQLMPELNPDYRMVPLTYRVVCRMPSPRPNYAKVRETLS